MNTLVVCSKCEALNRLPLERAIVETPICGSCKTELPFHHGVQSVSGTGLSKLVRTATMPVVVDFWANWCGPCRAFAPTFQQAAQQLQGRFVFAKVDTEAAPLAAQAFQIRSIPTLIVFREGIEVDRQSGALGLPAFLNYLNRWGTFKGATQ